MLPVAISSLSLSYLWLNRICTKQILWPTGGPDLAVPAQQLAKLPNSPNAMECGTEIVISCFPPSILVYKLASLAGTSDSISTSSCCAPPCSIN
ncbi:hypothetical protein M758_8G142000 [Ceratodon purpureus]|uniref:Uncharacterized protein n=1 Tax=Ceratodon purpureus TaxID=3225 RepID=A0A8T0H424_CERPU|nr:hypothetical protein KC19_8G145600 [Ceratodon purpureus]KAG0608903.1 hypothetical protein M758_8G142000 [Ceratodon purpureus]